MTFDAKLAIFFAAIFGTAWFVRRFPHHPASRLALHWYGPHPVHGETASSFFARRALYSFKLFAQALVAFLGFWLLVSWRPAIGETTYFMISWVGLPLLGGTFLLAAVLFCVFALKHRWLGPNPVFELRNDVPEA